ncbi:SagB/ThcOx family dehydrogenase [Candidatus Micrarchaeota archaeon]|nr:SagB/ThcOx family dehydrogenase [Candidatus Micrarchaeota archaeon]
MDGQYVAILVFCIIAMLAILAFPFLFPEERKEAPATCTEYPGQTEIVLPSPDYQGENLETTLENRRSVREYSSEEITLEELSVLLWAGDGTTSESGFRTAPSAGALYPVDLYLVPNRVENASCGIYRYLPEEHKLVLVKEGRFNDELYGMSYNQAHVRDGAAVVVLVGVPDRISWKYQERWRDFILIEAGHIAQNMLLEAVSLGIEAVPVGGFETGRVGRLLELEDRETVYMVVLGKSKS